MAKLIKVDGTETEVKPIGKKWTLNELQGYVGGYIEIMSGISPIRMIINEEGHLKGQKTNQKATMIVQKALAGKALRYVPVIVGNVLILDKTDKM